MAGTRTKYVDAEKLIAEIERLEFEIKSQIAELGNFESNEIGLFNYLDLYDDILSIITSLQQEQPEENKLPNKKTRVNYAICKLQSFKPIREAIVLDDYVYDEGKCYRENLLNYIHAIPENRLTEIRSYLKENGWWPYDDDADWMKQEQPKVDLEKVLSGFTGYYAHENSGEYPSAIDIARHFYELGLKAKEESK